MAISAIVKKKCPECGKTAIEKSVAVFGSSKLVSLECGHLISQEMLKSEDELYERIVSSDGRTLRNYQIEGVKFVEKSGVRCLIADEQRLGKTVQALSTIRLHSNLTPAICFTKTTITNQWYHEFKRWCYEQGYVIQVIKSGKEKLIPGFDIYIVSYDLAKNEELLSLLPPNYLQTFIIDECQAIKNHLSGRAKAIQNVCKDIPHGMALSGTPINNHAGEYFTVLNLLKPERFPTYQGFLEKYCDYYDNGYGYKVGGLSDPESFKEDTKDFILRRTRAEAAPEIPKINRQFYHVELHKSLHGTYRKLLQELEDAMYSEDSNLASIKMVIYAKMRRITGISKAVECTDYVTSSLESDPDEKMVVFLHHIDAATLLEKHLNEWMTTNKLPPVLNFSSSLSGNDRAAMIDKFKIGQHKVMLASTLAAGEGLTLDFVKHAVMLERQWNPANEEQAESRFPSLDNLDVVTVAYMIASETIDEYFTELVEAKRATVTSTLNGESGVAWDESGLMKQLGDILVTKGKKAWKL